MLSIIESYCLMYESAPNNEHNRAQQDITELLTVEDDAEYRDLTETYIGNRLEELEAGAQVGEIHGFSVEHQGFIHPETVISPFFLGVGFRVNDKNIYEQSLQANYVNLLHTLITMRNKGI